MYLLSPRKYFYHYFLYLREAKLGSPLFFGSLIETALDALFKGSSLEEAQAVFRKNFITYQVNGSTINLSNSPLVRYSKADLDLDIFTDKERQDLANKSLQFQSWSSLQRKGELMIEAYHRDILPRIKKVIATQLYFSIPNDAGDEINGFADLVCEWEDGRTILIDHKTSAQAYPADAVSTEQYGKQTALYYEAFKDKYKLDATGFFVMEKKIRKKEPRARTNIILGKPPEELIEKTFDEFDNVLHNIKQGEFPCLSPACDAYGQECCYKKYCKSEGKDMTGLVKVGKVK
jgi:hypothetical protein